MFRFESEASDGDRFSVVSFTGHEAISALYRYEIELKAPLSADIDLDDMLDSRARFITEVDGQDYPVHGVLSSLDELQTVQGYVYFRAVLTPRIWSLSTYKTNEIYTEEKTVGQIVRTVLESAGLIEGIDYDINGLIKDSLLQRDYICQFGESDFDFISRLMENEGIFYYFEQTGEVERIVFINDMNYEEITKPGLIYDVAAQTNRIQDSIHAWICRRQRLAANVTVRDFNPDQPSLDISDTMPIDNMGQGTEYIYGSQVNDTDEATYLTEIRAEEQICTKTRYYAESSVSRLRTGYLFGLSLHPNNKYNSVKYLVTEIAHEGRHIDAGQSNSEDIAAGKPQYHNSFTAISATDQYRPPRITAKPRFYGTMTAFIYAEAASGMVAEVDDQGRYRVHLPFDRANGTKDSLDPDRKASAWMRMAQPYVGEDEGTYYPLKGGTEVLLTFINGDPDQPIISGALPNAASPSLLNHENAHVTTIKTSGGIANVSGGGSYTNRSIPVADKANQASASALDDFRSMGKAEGDGQGNYSGHFMPPADFGKTLGNEPLVSDYIESTISDTTEFSSKFPFVKSNDFGQANDTPQFISREEEITGVDAHIDRSTGPMYVHRVGSTFAYPQQERVYFCGTFHEDFHMDDLGIIGKKRGRDSNWLMTTAVEDKDENDPQGIGPEVFHFPEPGGDGTQTGTPTELATRFPPNRKRGVSEDKRWGDQMSYAFGASYNWGAGNEICGAGVAVNYGNGITEDLINSSGGRFQGVVDDDSVNTANWDMYNRESANAVMKGRPMGSASAIDPNIPRNYQGKFVDGGNASALYNFVEGNTYSYQSGDDLDVNDGDSDSWCFGNSTEWVYGHSCSWVEGDTISYTWGSSTDFHFGNSNSLATGLTTDTFVGLKTETHVGGSIEFELAAKAGITATHEKFLSGSRLDATGKAESAALDKLTATLIRIDKSMLMRFDCGTFDLRAVKIDMASPAISMTTPMATINGAIIKVG